MVEFVLKASSLYTLNFESPLKKKIYNIHIIYIYIDHLAMTNIAMENPL